MKGLVPIPIQERIFDGFIIFTYIFYITGFILGLTIIDPVKFEYMDYFVKLYVGVFLIWRYNPYRTTRFTRLDRKMAFHAGIFIVVTLALRSIVEFLFPKENTLWERLGVKIPDFSTKSNNHSEKNAPKTP